MLNALRSATLQLRCWTLSFPSRSVFNLRFCSCRRCKLPLKEYNVETISLSIANLCQFVRFSPTSSVNILPQLLSQVSKLNRLITCFCNSEIVTFQGLLICFKAISLTGLGIKPELLFQELILSALQLIA